MKSVSTITSDAGFTRLAAPLAGCVQVRGARAKFNPLKRSTDFHVNRSGWAPKRTPQAGRLNEREGCDETSEGIMIEKGVLE